MHFDSAVVLVVIIVVVVLVVVIVVVVFVLVIVVVVLVMVTVVVELGVVVVVEIDVGVVVVVVVDAVGHLKQDFVLETKTNNNRIYFKCIVSFNFKCFTKIIMKMKKDLWMHKCIFSNC